MTMSCDDAGSSGVRRFEVFTGAGKRRDWPPEVKATIVAEMSAQARLVLAISASSLVSATARRRTAVEFQASMRCWKHGTVRISVCGRAVEH